MHLARPCIICEKTYIPNGKGNNSRYCESCVRNIFIKKVFKTHGKFKECKTLEEALEKYGFPKPPFTQPQTKPIEEKI